MLRAMQDGTVRRTVVLSAITAVVTLVAFVARLALIREAGLDGLHAYDDGVYYAGATALVSGRMPYQDFLFLHPPGILLALAPFAGLGRLTSDATGLAGARVAFLVLGSVNTALVTRVASRYGLIPAALGGLFYALWFPARYAERIPLLEAPGNTALLIALLLLGRTRAKESPRAQVLAGAALGFSVCVKIWMVVPLAVIVLWQLVSGGRQAALRTAAGAVVGGVLVIAPFLRAGDDMFRMVILDQLNRSPAQITLAERVTSIFGLTPLAERAPAVVSGAAVVWTAVVIALAALAALRQPAGKLYVALLVSTLAVLIASPSMFEHYGAYAAVPVALVLAAAAAAAMSAGAARRGTGAKGLAGRRLALGAVAAAVTPLLLLNSVLLAVDTGRPFPREGLRPDVADGPCVVSDDPTVLALLDVLGRDLQRGCPVLVDVTGLTYDACAMT
ncbi:MAG: hypothetical protein M3P48_11110, partial [Actinomycetota bacterium]|nr:hypothetical protein [Actinomycetota bacterium]